MGWGDYQACINEGLGNEGGGAKYRQGWPCVFYL